MNLVLASASPRRADLLRSAGLSYKILSATIDEAPLPGEESEELVKRLSLAKAAVVSSEQSDAVVLAADTIVEHDGEILGKPTDEEHAFEILSALSGDSHEVMTGFTLISPEGRVHTEVVVTAVEFREISEDELRAYISSGDPMDKAGAYGIQSGAAGFVKRVTGSYTNVVGLPLAEVIQALKEF